MKKHHLLIINLIFFGLITFSAGVVYQFMTGNKPLEIVSSLFHRKKTPPTITTNQCNVKAPLNLDTAQDPHLRKLRTYQNACHSYVTDTMMLFTDMPTSADSALKAADQIATTLKEYQQAGVRPLVIAEPNGQWGNIDFETFASGAYDQWIDAYFKEIKAKGVTDSQMGIWNPFPEANLPYWNNNKPEFFAPSVTRYLTTLRATFPGAKTSVLLNSATYQVDDFDWRNGDYVSLVQYVKGIPAGLVDYAGLQGFPWIAPQGDDTNIFNGAEFVNASLLSEMADSLKTKNVWFNTGTFASKYTLDPGKRVDITPERRKDILLTIDEEALKLKKKNYNVAINMFAQDKSADAEATDWSYWKNDKPFESIATPVLTEFISQLPSQGIDFWLFDQ
ncbi:MAG TPA: hypothetical protein VLF60_05230 [Candidatus Saccharimonadales bacterium]|nr:hypothetical protein [Candidatus Saccharimonadales bacterium]